MREITITAIMAVFIFMPSVGKVFGASSMAAGTLFSAVFATVVSLVVGVQAKNFHIIRFSIISAIISSSFIYLGLLFSVLTNLNVDVTRSYSSLFVFVFFMISAGVVLGQLRRIESRIFSSSLRNIFYLSIFFGIIGVLGFSPFYEKSKSVFIFSEPSHYGLMIFPFFLYSCIVSSNLYKFIYIAIILSLSLIFQNLTMVIVCSFTIFIIFKIRLFLTWTIFMILGGMAVIDLQYYISRLNFGDNIDNISSIVYASALERAYLSVIHNFPLGVGFQQMGIVGPAGTYMDMLDDLNLSNLNSLDGSLTGAKIITEFGIFGILIIFLYLYKLVHEIHALRMFSCKSILPADSFNLFCSCCYVSYSIELFVRGTGYLAMSTFLLIISLFNSRKILK